jgi:hypothetical protein
LQRFLALKSTAFWVSWKKNISSVFKHLQNSLANIRTSLQTEITPGDQKRKIAKLVTW